MQQKKSPGQYQLLLLLVDPCFKQEQQQKKIKTLNNGVRFYC